MSAYFEDLRELQHAIHRTELVYQETLEDQQHRDRKESTEREERQQKLRDREMRKLAARHEIERWNERGWDPPAPQSGHHPVKDESLHPNQPEGQDEASSAQGAVEEQDARMLPSWARKILAVADRIEFENETVENHKIHRRRLDKDGQGHQKYLATQQHLRGLQTGSHQQLPRETRSDTRNGNQEDPQALQQQLNEQFENVRSPASSNGSTETVVADVDEHRSDEEDGAADNLKKETRRSGKGKALDDNPKNQEALASNETTGKESAHGAAESRVVQQTELDRPVLVTKDTPDEVRDWDIVAQVSPAQRQGSPPKAGLDPAQSEKLERKQQQKAATELRKKQRQEKRKEEKRQKMMEERRAEEDKKKEDEGFWQWLKERQLANPNATVASLSKERYLREAKQKKEQEAREARRKRQREERAAIS